MTDPQDTGVGVAGDPAACGCAPGNESASSRPPGGRTFRIEGMDCAQEVAALRREVGPLVGGADYLAFDLMTAEMTVSAPPSAASDEAISVAVRRAGLRAAPLIAPAPDSAGSWWLRHGRTAATVASGAALAGGLVAHAAVGGPPAALGAAPGAGAPALTVALYLVATVSGAWFVLPRAWASARALRPDMNLLMTIATAGALALGDALEAATVAFLFAIALLLESWSVGRARNAVRALLDVAPPTARLRDVVPGRSAIVAADDVRVGEVIVVHPGERLPLDGVVVAGAAGVDSAPVTGESRPDAVGPGSEVFAGTIALDGALEVRVTRPAADTLVARIVRRVAEAGRRRAKSERWVDRFAIVYTPTVFAAALLVALVPPLLAGAAWGEWIYRALVLLVIGCPCALVISTPVSVVAGLASAARHGVLVKGGDILERPAGLGAIAFDKTGTLTTGRLTVAAVTSLDGHADDDVLALAAALEARSGHPIGRAIVAEAGRRGLALRPVAEVRVVPGRGAEGVVAGEPAWLGSHRLLEERGQESPELHRLALAAERSGRSVVVVGRDSHVCGLVTLEDAPRPEAGAAVAALRKLGCGRVALLSGDNRETAEAIAAEVGITEVHAALLPDDKATVIDELRRSLAITTGKKGLVAFVGDGINDAPALAAADLGIAFGERATDVAIETADVALIGPALTRIPWLVAHSRRVLRVIRANIAFALAVKAAFVLLTVLGSASLWAAIAADMGASLLVIANSLRLLRR